MNLPSITLLHDRQFCKANSSNQPKSQVFCGLRVRFVFGCFLAANLAEAAAEGRFSIYHKAGKYSMLS